MEMIDFDDLPDEDGNPDGVKMVGLTLKITEDEKEMLQRIAKRQRRNLSGLSAFILREYVEKYIADYKASKQS